MTFSVRPARGASSPAARQLHVGWRIVPGQRRSARFPTAFPFSRFSRSLGFSRPPGFSRPLRPHRFHFHRPLSVVAGLSAVLLLPALAACSSQVAPDGTAAAPVPSPPDTSAPVVTNATDLGAIPAIAAGEGEPPTDLVARDLVVGTGAPAMASSTVLIHYVGALWKDGKTFDSSRDGGGGGQPSIFPLDQVIPGFAQGIEGMKVGGRRELVIPPALGYGPQGGRPPVIAADDTLVFVVDLVGVQGAANGAGPSGDKR